MTSKQPRPRRDRGEPRLLFAPLAWLKLVYFCHAGDTEIAGFAITAKDDPLYVKEFVTVRQQTSATTVALDDQAVADFLDRAVDAGLKPQQVLRIWLHTHPDCSAEPSNTDEKTFARVFGSCDWAVMFILSRTAEIYARLSFHSAPAPPCKSRSRSIGGLGLASSTIQYSRWPIVSPNGKRNSRPKHSP